MITRAAKRKLLNVQPTESCYFFTLLPELRRLILNDYVGYPLAPVMRLVCKSFRETVGKSCSGKFFVPRAIERGYLALARWAWNHGAEYDIQCQEGFIKVAEMDDLVMLKWMIRNVSKHVPGGVYRMLVLGTNRHLKFLAWMKTQCFLGDQKYHEALFLRAIRDNDEPQLLSLFMNGVKPPAAAWGEAVRQNRLHVLDQMRLIFPIHDGSAVAYNVAVELKNWDALRWLDEHQYRCSPFVILKAISANDSELVRWLVPRCDTEWCPTMLCAATAFEGNMFMLDLLVELECEYDDESIMRFAITQRNEDLLLWCVHMISDAKQDLIYESVYGNPGSPFAFADPGSHRLWLRDHVPPQVQQMIDYRYYAK
jgi:hypothetical protein